jgi:hypothetical protein
MKKIRNIYLIWNPAGFPLEILLAAGHIASATIIVIPLRVILAFIW